MYRGWEQVCSHVLEKKSDMEQAEWLASRRGLGQVENKKSGANLRVDRKVNG